MNPYESRRKALLEQLDHSVAIFPAAPVTVRNKDIDHPYRQDSDFFYLTGLDEPDAVLILTTAHPDHRSVIFLRPRNPEKEQWEGRRLGVDEAASRLGVDTAYPIEQFEEKLPDYLQDARSVVARLGRDASFDRRLFDAIEVVRARWKQRVNPPTRFVDPEENLHEMRLRKSPDEVETIRRAAEISAEGYRELMSRAHAGMYEYELEAILDFEFRRRGAQRHAFEPIVASGSNATVLHYTSNNRRIEQDELVLVDAGCELDGYASDITRTFPVSGKFTAEQRAVYEIVLRAQEEAIAMARPGATLDQLHEKVCAVLAEGLVELGLLEDDLQQVMEQQSYRRFFPHRTSHWMGMDVHDVGRYYEHGTPRTLEPGMVFTVEPGLYIPPTGDQAPSRFQGIGVRIEDDVLITRDGCEVITDGIPKSVEDIEAACSES